MKFKLRLSASLLFLSFTSIVQAEPHLATGCAAKRLNIEHQIDYARAKGNSHREEGLKIALSELNANCTDEGLRSEREADVRKKERKVTESRHELAEAQADGREDKIEKRRRKLAEAQSELDDARAALKK